MLPTWRRFVFILLLVASSLDARTRIHLPPPPPPQDIFTNANANDVHTEHLSLDLEVDFGAERIRGSATHRIANAVGARELILDTRGLDIQSVTADGAATQWSLGAESSKGQALSIAITPSTRSVRVDYRTRPTAAALRWMERTQTMGRVLPALVTQGQPDLTRSWIPIQDTPAARMTWDATVRVPPGLLALMSGRNPQAVREDGVYTFEQRRAVPAYLIVLAVGRFEFRPLDGRTGIYAEPEQIDAAVYEMQHVPQMLQIAESILGPYPYTRYDLLFAPKFGGGMENTELNFIGPGLISGNHPERVAPSGLIAHELAHSWVGDMVTCATWSDTWLNEGFATYYEKRIMELIQNEERAELGLYFDRRNYEDYIANPNITPRLTALHRVFAGTEGPGSTFNTVSYQKGGMFLKMLEDRIGRTRFDAIIAEYLRKYAFHWVDDRAFLSEVTRSLEGEPSSFVDSLMMNQWVYQGGLPTNVTAPRSSRIWDRILVQSRAYRDGTALSQIDRNGWTSLEESLFLQQIPDLISARLVDLDQGFGFSGRNTPPLTWLVGIARTRNAALLPVVERFLERGDNESLPIWYELGQSVAGRQFAVPLYLRVKPYYSDNNRQIIESYLRITAKEATEIEPETFKEAA